MPDLTSQQPNNLNYSPRTEPYLPYQAPYFDPYGAFRYNYTGQPQPMMPQQVPQQPIKEPVKPGFIYRPVGGVEEVKSLAIDWDGTMYMLEDAANSTIYKKQFIDGVVKTVAYAKIEIPEPTPVTYVTTETIEELKIAFAQQLARIEEKITIPVTGNKARATVSTSAIPSTTVKECE